MVSPNEQIIYKEYSLGWHPNDKSPKEQIMNLDWTYDGFPMISN